MRRAERLLAFIALVVLLGAASHDAAAQSGEPVLYYRTYPGENLADVVRTRETTAAGVRRLNPGKIGPNGEIKAYTQLAIPTRPQDKGKRIGATLPQSLRQARSPKPAPPRPAARAARPTPRSQKPTAGAAPARPRPAAPVASSGAPQPASPSAASPARQAPAPMPPPASNPAPAADAPSPPATPPRYTTRDAPTDYSAKDAPPLGQAVGRFLVALTVVVGALYLGARLIKHFGWEGRLARLGGTHAGAKSAGVPEPGKAVGTAFAAHLDAARQEEAPPAPRDHAGAQAALDARIREARAAAEPAAPRRTDGPVPPETAPPRRPDSAAKNSYPSTLLGNVQKANTITRTEAFDTDPDDDIPQTSLDDALRRRKSS